MYTFTTPGPVTTTVQVAGARVGLTASKRTDTVVRVEPIDATSRSDVAVANRTKVDLTDGRLTVKTTRSGDKDGSVAITIDLPTASGLIAYLAHSDVHADGPLGECELHLAHGRVQLDRIDALQANISSGEVAVGVLAGSAEVEGGEGGLRIDELEGNVVATTGSGSIQIGRMTHGQARLMTGSGTIEIGVDKDSAASIDAASERGAVHDFASTQEPSHPSDHEVTVLARTRHGDITVRRTTS